MAIPYKPIKPKPKSSILILFMGISLVVMLYTISLLKNSQSSPIREFENVHKSRYLYWGDRVDCPGKHCETCAGLGHQESSLRCALEEAIFTRRIFVMPSRMCINPIHNNKDLLHHSDSASSKERWAANSCAMDSLYDIDLISETVPVILDNSNIWHHVLSTAMKLGAAGIAHAGGVSRVDLKENDHYSNLLIINRTVCGMQRSKEPQCSHVAIHISSHNGCKRLKTAAEKIKVLLGDYDAIHVRRGDILKTRKDRFGVERSLHPHLDRDTRPEFILRRIEKWVPSGRTLYIASNERTPGFFSPLSVRYKLAYSSNYSEVLDPVIENNYQLFMIERLIMMGAKTFINTYKEDDSSLSLTDDPKKNTKIWQIPVYTMDGEGS